MPDEEYTKRVIESFASFLTSTSDKAEAGQLLLDFLALATSASTSNDFVDSIFLTSSVSREEYGYRHSLFINKLRKQLDLKK